jgi:hypothetical protein|tara:strand:+ start:1346 stop:2236 length:891 start_codon:yes stop_codon:yes gene_type:complete
MKNAEVKKLSPVEVFFYWCKERHKIYKFRQKNKPKPWTDDEILQRYFFTNPYRENDRVTQWYRENIREPLEGENELFFATVAFRWFNKPDPTGNILIAPTLRKSLLLNWDIKSATRQIKAAWGDGKQPVFTSAFMISAGKGRGAKIPGICKRVNNVWKERKEMVEFIEDNQSMRAVCEELQRRFEGLGSFMAYELVCDFRHTFLLEDADDVMTWCNIGPGAKRGLNRILGVEEIETTISKDVWDEGTATLLKESRKRKMHPHFEMREVEHSLCEFDKYSRALDGETNRMKRRYPGV